MLVVGCTAPGDLQLGCGTVITFSVSSAIGTQVGTGQGAAWGEAWEGEPYVDVGEGLCSTVCWWSPRLLFDLTEVP